MLGHAHTGTSDVDNVESAVSLNNDTSLGSANKFTNEHIDSEVLSVHSDNNAHRI